MTQLDDLPTEIIEQILTYLPPVSIAKASQTCRALATICDTPLLWKHCCQSTYRYWDPRHNFKSALAAPVEETSWKDVYASRNRLDRQVDKLLDQMINNVQDRITVMETIVNIQSDRLEGGSRDLWDVKDALNRHVNCDDDAEDVLARRFWAQATLDRLHRSTAITHWLGLQTGETTLEQALSNFDLFVDGMEDAECGDNKDILDDLAEQFRKDHLDYQTQSIRWQAITLAEFLRANGFQGITQEDQYHNLPNNFIGRALRNPDHPALPIICVGIYCALASRIGIDAQPCGFPMHVYAVVQSAEKCDLDDKVLENNAVPQRMYIDAFRTPIEVPVSHLQSQLSSMGADPRTLEQFLGPASANSIIIRASRNIIRSVKDRHFGAATATATATDTSDWPDEDVAFYAALWTAMCIRDNLEVRLSSDHQRMRQHLPFLLEQFQSYFPWDSGLFETHILPQLYSYREVFAQILDVINMVRRVDRDRPIVVRRDTSEKQESVKYKIGQVFRHKRYEYSGVIIGWDVNCDASEDWIAEMGVDRLGRGRSQSFYNVLAEDKSNRYVAEDNIVPIDDKPSLALLKLAGRYFRRWDDESNMLVSNIKEEYPDD